MVSFDAVAPAWAESERCAPTPLTRCSCGLLILNDHRRVGIRGGNRQTPLLQDLDVLLHPPAGLVQAILNGMPDSRKSVEIRRIEPKKRRIVGCRDDDSTRRAAGGSMTLTHAARDVGHVIGRSSGGNARSPLRRCETAPPEKRSAGRRSGRAASQIAGRA